MEIDLQSLFGLLCTPVLIGWDPATPPPPPIPPHLGSYTRAQLVGQDRRHLFVTACFQVYVWSVHVTNFFLQIEAPLSDNNNFINFESRKFPDYAFKFCSKANQKLFCTTHLIQLLNLVPLCQSQRNIFLPQKPSDSFTVFFKRSMSVDFPAKYHPPQPPHPKSGKNRPFHEKRALFQFCKARKGLIYTRT